MPAAVAIPAAIEVAGVVGSGIAGSGATNNAKQDLANAANASQVNQQSIENNALSLGSQNAAASQQLLQQYAPWAIPLQSAGNNAVTAGIANTSGVNAGQAVLTNNISTPLNTPVGNASIAAAGQQLALGGQLGQGTQNAVAQAALQNAGGVTQGGLGLGRNLTAQDLGLTSLALQQQRISQANQAGTLEQSTAQLNTQNMLNRIAALSGLQQAQFGRSATAANIGNSIQAPATGISPGSALSIAGANAGNLSSYYTNLANVQGQQGQNLSNGIGQLTGIGMQGYNTSGGSGGGTGGQPSPAILNALMSMFGGSGGGAGAYTGSLYG